MSTREFLTSATIIAAAMALAALMELVVPLFSAPSRPRRVRANLGLTTLTLLFNWILTSAAALLAVGLSLQRPGLLVSLGLPPWAQLVASIVMLDFFFGYLAHRTMHVWPLMWRVHRMHHSDPFVDVTTTYRTHPIEVAWRFGFMMVPVWVAGIPAQAVVIYRLVSAINGILEHANLRVWPRLDSAISLLWVTPNMHKDHHSREHKETDSNYGNILSVYDRVLRTFTPTARGLSVVYGLVKSDTAASHSLLALLLMPLWARRSTIPRRVTQAATTAAVVAIAGFASLTAVLPPPAAALDTAKIEELTRAKGKLDEKDGAFKVSVPRTDLAVTVGGVHLTPPMGLTSWAAFKPAGAHAMVMGDLVLLEDQVNPVMSTALDNGLQVTALHNHFFWDTPKVMFMHIGGMADEGVLAAAVGNVFAKIQQTSGGKGDVPHADIDPAKTSLRSEKIDSVLGTKGELKDGVYKVVIGRAAKMDGTDIGSTMGVNTWAAFAGSDDNAVVDGDFAMLENELQGVLKALRAAGINVVAIHQHMIGETPRIMFLHYWGVGSTEALAGGLKAALATQRN